MFADDTSIEKMGEKRENHEDGSGNGEKIHEYSPELRTTAQNEYLQQVFRRIELTLNVGKGTVSDAESVQQTATQYSGDRTQFAALSAVNRKRNFTNHRGGECVSSVKFCAKRR